VSPRRPVLAVVGHGDPIDAATTSEAQAVGRLAIDAGFRRVTGGLGGGMAAAAVGARSSSRRQEGDIVAILPGRDAGAAHAESDIVIPSGLGLARNVLVVATADVVVVVGGGAGTLSEIALAWQLGKPVVALTSVEGWGAALAGQALDERRGAVIIEAANATQAIAAASAEAAVRDDHPGGRAGA
jgi:uncharacterized protein (TIGR00725 family)